MAEGKQRTDQTHSPPAADGEAEAAGGRFSLHRLSAAFARLTGSGNAEAPPAELANRLGEVEDLSEDAALGEAISPRMIVEGMLFVGTADGRPLTNREMAAHVRDVSPKEVDALILELNNQYEEAAAPYHIVSEGPGYQMQIRPQHEAVRRRFGGRVREAKLTPQAIEVLSIIAYRQPVTAEKVGLLRGSRSHAMLNQLVRRGLLCLERPDSAADDNSRQQPTYYTTERFNRLFGIDSPQDLPSSEDLDDK
jgi:segregation and condensation protein B